MKLFILDPLYIAVALLVLAVVFVIFGLLWINFLPAVTYGIPTNSPTYTQITGLGNNFFLSAGDSILVIFYFILVAGMFMSAIALGGNPLTLPVGLLIGLVAIIVTMPLSDLAHNILTNPLFVPASSHYLGTLYILDNLPFFTGIEILVYLLFATMVAERIRERLGISSQGFGGRMYGG